MIELWDRYTKLVINSPSSETTKTVTSDELTIYFRTSRYMTANSSISYGATEDNTILAEIMVYNLSPNTLADITHENMHTKKGGSTVTLMSGYRDHNGVVFTGIVASMTQQRIGADMVTLLYCRSSKAIVQNTVVNVQYSAGKSISELVNALAVEAHIPIGRIDDIPIPVGNRTYAPVQSLDSIFIELMVECGDRCRYEFENGALYFLDMDNKERTLYDLNPGTGLLSMYLEYDPAYTNDTYNVTTLLLPGIRWMGAVKIGEHICTVVTRPTYISTDTEHCTKFLSTVGGIPRRSTGFWMDW